MSNNWQKHACIGKNKRSRPKFLLLRQLRQLRNSITCRYQSIVLNPFDTNWSYLLFILISSNTLSHFIVTLKTSLRQILIFIAYNYRLMVSRNYDPSASKIQVLNWSDNFNFRTGNVRTNYTVALFRWQRRGKLISTSLQGLVSFVLNIIGNTTTSATNLSHNQNCFTPQIFNGIQLSTHRKRSTVKRKGETIIN